MDIWKGYRFYHVMKVVLLVFIVNSVDTFEFKTGKSWISFGESSRAYNKIDGYCFYERLIYIYILYILYIIYILYVYIYIYIDIVYCFMWLCACSLTHLAVEYFEDLTFKKTKNQIHLLNGHISKNRANSEWDFLKVHSIFFKTALSSVRFVDVDKLQGAPLPTISGAAASGLQGS